MLIIKENIPSNLMASLTKSVHHASKTCTTHTKQIPANLYFRIMELTICKINESMPILNLSF